MPYPARRRPGQPGAACGHGHPWPDDGAVYWRYVPGYGIVPDCLECRAARSRKHKRIPGLARTVPFRPSHWPRTDAQPYQRQTDARATQTHGEPRQSAGAPVRAAAR